MEREDLHILTDKGYFSAHEILACHKAGITTTVPRSDTSGSRAKGHFVKADFAYEPGADMYRCPAGRALTHRITTEQQGLQMRRYWTNACKGCSLKDRCTTWHERLTVPGLDLNTPFLRGLGRSPSDDPGQDQANGAAVSIEHVRAGGGRIDRPAALAVTADQRVIGLHVRGIRLMSAARPMPMDPGDIGRVLEWQPLGALRDRGLEKGGAGAGSVDAIDGAGPKAQGSAARLPRAHRIHDSSHVVSP
ncbi:hypothetical protein JWJ88_19170 [Paracoccus methylovorus]|uniref:Transposase DDE domain-containing protein n=1 Tax=Paracoccus methylovorus TaxID=2812658 RepID=A0ABX7JM50_9RHOB|nr:hypothetical protein JWJ88_19170 [Paracoccus methylovorus]